MESLRLHDCEKITNISLFNIAANCSNLKDFSADGTKFTGAGFTAVQKKNPLAKVQWETYSDNYSDADFIDDD